MAKTGRKCMQLGGFLAVLLAASWTAAQAPPAGPPPEKPAEQVYKNIQVLKGMPASQLIPTMQFMSGSLGVPCEHCHVDPRESDAKKEKVTARKMIQMVAAIDRDHFEGRAEVTCNSCHHGQPKPATVPAIAQAAWVAQMQPQPSAPASVPSVDDLFARYLKAVGGREAADAIQTRVYKGTATGYDGNEAPRPTPIEMYASGPGKLLVVQQLPNGAASSYAYDGDSGWMKNPRGVRALNPREVETVRERAAALDLIQLDDYLTTKVAGQETVNGRAAWVVEGTRRGASPVKLWFDAENGLLVRKQTQVATAFGPSPLQTDFADYRPVGKLKLPFRVTSGTLSSGVVREFSDIQLNLPVEDSKFAMPAAAK
ncbi:MAG TPA: photosynthetic reaction center cytochrome c subunit family protein [Terriglobales bacterium]|nr:photosynthetic reaction center cytochrome c subunit family protein [Terriglobales bacterium]